MCFFFSKKVVPKISYDNIISLQHGCINCKYIVLSIKSNVLCDYCYCCLYKSNKPK